MWDGGINVRRAIGAFLVIVTGILLGFYLNLAKEKDVSLVSFEFKSSEWGENEN